MRSRAHDLVTRYGLLETLDPEHFYTSIDTAVADIHSTEQTAHVAQLDAGGTGGS